jgi:archaellum biogenesis ATPase FlaH
VGDLKRFEELIEFIENVYDRKLYDYQKKMLKWMIEGKKFSSPIISGRKMILEGYVKWLQVIHGKHLMYGNVDEHITLNEVLNESERVRRNLIVIDELDFKREYECEWVGKSDKD